MRYLVSLMLASVVAFSPCAWADVVTDWYGVIPKALANSPRAQYGRAQMLTAIAMFNALNAVAPRYQSYAPAPEPMPDASADIAAITAAWIILGSVPGADHALLDKT